MPSGPTSSRDEGLRQAPAPGGLHGASTPRGRGLLGLSLTVLPIVALALLLRRYHVDVVFWDQWELVPIVDKVFQGTLTFSDLWAQHNEHRPVFPRLVMAHLARATGWSLSAEVLLNLGLVTTVLPVLWVSARGWRSEAQADVPPWTWPTMSLLLFSPTQWENWLWGWQFLAFVQVVTGVYGLALLTRRDSGWGSLAAALLLGIVGTFSFGGGLVFWPVGALGLLVQRHPARWQRLAVWISVAAVVLAAYFYDYHPNPYMPTPWSNFERVRAAGKLVFFVATFLGAPLAPGDWRWACLAGFAGVLLWGWLGYRSLAHGVLARAGLLPWLLGLTAIFTAVLIGLGRAGFGFHQALESRYVTASLWLWASLVLGLGTLRASGPGDRPDSTSSFRLARAGIVAVVVACLLGFSWPHGARASEAWRDRLLPARQALLEGSDLDTLKRLYPMPEAVVERREVLRRWNLGAFRTGDRKPATPVTQD